MRIAAIVAVSIALGGFAQAQVGAPFRGNTVTVYVGASPGGGYDIYGRLVARHIGKHLPGQPTVIASNMPGGMGFTAANFLYNAAPKDGTALAVLVPNIAEAQVLGSDVIQYDAAKFGWVGRIAPNVEIAYVWHTVPVKRFEDLQQRETIFAGQGASAFLYPTLLNRLLNTKIKVVRGYNATASVHLAMERGEVEGVTGSLGVISSSAPDWVRDKKVTIILQYQQERHRDLASVPAVLELIQSPEDREVFAFFISSATVGRSIVAPPGLPPDRLALLRRAFDDTMNDPQFVTDAAQAKFELGPLPGTALQAIVERQVNVSPAIRDRILALGWRP
jgi:tripartite-type tricarboxylate transporter receptor subunit TctC